METPPAQLPQSVLDGLRRREVEAMETFFGHYFDRVYGYVHRVIGNTSDAEDITQIAFMKMHRAINTLDRDRDPTPWVFTVAANAIRDFWRSRQRRNSQRESTIDDHPNALGLVEYQTPETNVQASDLLARVEKHIGRLGENLRHVLMLRDVEGLSYPEIAGVLNIEEATARKRHSRAIQELRKLMQGDTNLERDIS